MSRINSNIDADEVIEEYVDSLDAGESRRSDAYQIWEWALEEKDKDLLELTVQDLEEFCEHLDAEGYAGITIREKVSSFRSVCNYADKYWDDFEWPEPKQYYYVNKDDKKHPDHIDLTNYDQAPASVVDNPPSDFYLTRDEYEQMLEAAQESGLRDECLIRILFETGVRATEASNIELDHIHWDERRIEVKNLKKNATASRDEQWRDVFFSSSTKVRLKQYAKRGGREKYKHASESPYLFLTLRSPQMDQTAVNRRVVKMAKRAGIQKEERETPDGRSRATVRAHTLRHSFAVNLALNGCSLVIIAQLMGIRADTVERFYSRFTNLDQKQAYEKYQP